MVLEGSLSMLDARRWRIVPGTGLAVDRRFADGKVVGRLVTRSNANVTDMIPKMIKPLMSGLELKCRKSVGAPM